MLINNRNKSLDISMVARRPQLQSPWPTTERQKFQVGDAVMVRELPALFDPTPEWFYIVRFNQSELWHGYTGTTTDTLQTELPERWLQAAT